MKWAFLASLALGSCASAWDNYPHSLYSALRSESPQAIKAHHKLLEDLCLKAEQSGKKPPAGISAEYAYYSYKVGRPDIAQAALEKERTDYPESAKFVALLERFLPQVATVESMDEPGGQ